MKIANGIISAFLAVGLFGFLTMMGIFGGGAAAQAGQLAMANTVMWGAIILGLLGLALNVLGQLKYHRLAEADSTRMSLVMMYSCIPFIILFFMFCFIFVFES